MAEIKNHGGYKPEETSMEHRVSAVTKATVKKKQLGRRIFNSLIEEDFETICDQAVEEVIVPRVKDSLLEIVETILFGNSKGRGKRNKTDKASYAAYYYGNNYGYAGRRDDMEVRHSGFDINDLVLESYGEASEVLQNLIELTAKYGFARVGDYYDLVGVSSRKDGYTCNNYGWFDVDGTRIIRARGGGYILDLPRPVALD